MMAFFLIFIMSITAAVNAELKINDIFKDNMVLQRNQEVSVYGTSTPSSKVIIEFNGQLKSTMSDSEGNWELKLSPMEKNFSSKRLVASSANKKEQVFIKNILVGDVWLCGGQSNMERWFDLYPLLKEKAKEIYNPDIRCIVMKRREAGAPEEALIPKEIFSDSWREAKAPWASSISPTAYYFARKLRDDLDVPIGLITSAVGGSQIQRWMPKDVVQKMNLDSESSDSAGALYNSMIHPLRDLTIKGVIWYQGESNGRIPHSYYALSTEHIKCWRNIWSQNNPHLKDMPFYTVQIAPFQTKVDNLADDAWAYVRDAQLKTLALPNTGLAVTTDLGEYADIHPQDKQPVGHRLALWAKHAEGKDIIPSGPLFQKAVIKGKKVKVYFDFVGSGLETRPVIMSSKKNVWAKDDPDAYVVTADNLQGFSVCGPDKKFVPAEAKIVNDHVVVSSKQISQPIAVRYGWSTFPLCNLFNKEGLPASPFRSDNFPVPDVQGRKYGRLWDQNQASLGYKMQFIGSNSETSWDELIIEQITGFTPAQGQTKPLYAYYKVNFPEFCYGKSPKMTISLTYYDNHDGTLAVQYDSSDPMVKVVEGNPGAWKNAVNIKLKKTGKWNVFEIPLDDAFFGKRCNSADIRINCNNNKTILGPVFCRKQ